jgi:hypothetical protein
MVIRDALHKNHFYLVFPCRIKKDGEKDIWKRYGREEDGYQEGELGMNRGR